MSPERRRLTLFARHPRILHAGPRVRLFEFAVVAHVVLVFLGAFLAWIALSTGDRTSGALLLAACSLLVVLDVVRYRQLKLLRTLGTEGAITSGEVTRARMRARWWRRADRVYPAWGTPPLRALEVTYEFEDEHGRSWNGRFLTSKRDRHTYARGNPIEVFYLRSEPSRNECSLVLRWYYRLGGPMITDEPPPEGSTWDPLWEETESEGRAGS